MSLSSFAQDQQDRISVENIDWSAYNQSLGSIVGTSDAPKITYLYATTPKKFVTVGGLYGAQPILAEVGMNFYVEKVSDADDSRYYIHSWVDNPTTSHENGSADYLGVKPTMDNDERIFSVQNDETKKSIYLFVDRGKLNAEDYKDENGNLINSSPDRVKWYIESVGTNNGYKIYSKWMDNQGYSDPVERNYYLSYYQGPIEEGKPQQKFLVVTTDESKAETFYFIQIDDYHKVINSQNKSISMYLVLCRMLVSNETTKVLMVTCVVIMIQSQRTMFGSSVTTETKIPMFSQICRIMCKIWHI